jgi:hypothetical protein
MFKKNLNVNFKFLKGGKSLKLLHKKYFQSHDTLEGGSSGNLSSYWLALEIRKTLLKPSFKLIWGTSKRPLYLNGRFRHFWKPVCWQRGRLAHIQYAASSNESPNIDSIGL